MLWTLRVAGVEASRGPAGDTAVIRYPLHPRNVYVFGYNEAGFAVSAMWIVLTWNLESVEGIAALWTEPGYWRQGYATRVWLAAERAGFSGLYTAGLQGPITPRGVAFLRGLSAKRGQAA